MMGTHMKPDLFFFIFGAASLLAACGGSPKPQAQTSSSPASQTPTVNVTTVQSLELNRQIRLPGELQAWEDTAIKGLTWSKYSAILNPEIRSPFVELMSCEREQR